MDIRISYRRLESYLQINSGEILEKLYPVQ